MAMRLQELHPTLVHLPIGLMPVAIGADLLARLTGSERLAEVGRMLMPLAAASAAVSAVAGLVAQEEVVAEGEAAELLATHRTLNLSLVGVSALMAGWRWGREQAGPGYLALGLAGLGTMGYSAYLGGKMVYDHGVGVEAAGGVRPGAGPELVPSQAGEVARRTVQDLQRSIPQAVEDARAGQVVPTLTKDAARAAGAVREAAGRVTGQGGSAAAGASGGGSLGLDAGVPDGAGAPESIP